MKQKKKEKGNDNNSEDDWRSINRCVVNGDESACNCISDNALCTCTYILCSVWSSTSVVRAHYYGFWMSAPSQHNTTWILRWMCNIILAHIKYKYINLTFFSHLICSQVLRRIIAMSTAVRRTLRRAIDEMWTRSHMSWVNSHQPAKCLCHNWCGGIPTTLYVHYIPAHNLQYTVWSETKTNMF